MQENNDAVPQTDSAPVENTETNEVAEATATNQNEPLQTAEESTETTEQNTEVEATAETPVEEPQYNLTDYMQPETKPNFTPDEDGYIDPNKFYNQVLQDAEARIEQKMAFERAEAQAWKAIETKYPEIKEDPELRDLVHSQRIADVAQGGKGDLNKIAGKVLGKIQSYQTRGKAQAQVSETVQKSAALQTTTANQETKKTTDSDLVERMSRGDSNAAEELISQWLKSGKL